MKTFLTCMLFALTAAPLAAQLEPVQQRRSKIDLALLAADAGVHAMDVCSTRRLLNNGGHEMFLPDAVVDSTAGMALYSASVTIGLQHLSAQLRPWHPRLARLIPILDIAATAPFVIHNFTIDRNPQRSRFNQSEPLAYVTHLR